VESTENEMDWLGLEILCRRPLFRTGLVVQIKFINRGSEEGILRFSNAHRGAELLGLRIATASGVVIEPTPGVKIRPIDSRSTARTLKPGRSWIYSLRGRVVEGNLQFPGATFALQAGAEYRITFQYMGVESNAASWRMPS
jgi:hypothetical protein